MFKKYIAIFCIYVSYIILLGHNIFPHSHNNTDNTEEHHHHKGIGHLFDHYLHSDDSFITNKVSHKIYATSIDYNSNILHVGFDIIKNELHTQLIFSTPETELIYISTHWCRLGLRAPPSFV